MAQLSTTISHAQSATAFHFLISNLFFSQVAGASTSMDAILENFQIIFLEFFELFKAVSEHLYSRIQNRLFRRFECRSTSLFLRADRRFDKSPDHCTGNRSFEHVYPEGQAQGWTLFEL